MIFYVNKNTKYTPYIVPSMFFHARQNHLFLLYISLFPPLLKSFPYLLWNHSPPPGGVRNFIQPWFYIMVLTFMFQALWLSKLVFLSRSKLVFLSRSRKVLWGDLWAGTNITINEQLPGGFRHCQKLLGIVKPGAFRK